MEDRMRRMMGMPSRAEEKKARRRQEKENSRQQQTYGGGNGARRHDTGDSASDLSMMRVYAEDVEFTEIREYSEDISFKQDRKKTEFRTEEQVSDAEFTEIKTTSRGR